MELSKMNNMVLSGALAAGGITALIAGGFFAGIGSIILGCVLLGGGIVGWSKNKSISIGAVLVGLFFIIKPGFMVSLMHFAGWGMLILAVILFLIGKSGKKESEPKV